MAIRILTGLVLAVLVTALLGWTVSKYFYLLALLCAAALTGGIGALWDNHRDMVPHTRGFPHPENDNCVPFWARLKHGWGTFLFIVGLAAFNKKESDSLYD